MNSPEFDLSTNTIGEELLTTYELSELLYKSPISYIYLLKRRDNKVKYTLKAIKKQPELDLKIDSLKNIEHKNIAKILDISESEKYIYILKEYIEGMNLKKYIRDKGTLDEMVVETILNQLLDIFDYFHSQNQPIIYRDLKPENIIYNNEKNIFLIDLVTIREVKKANSFDTFYIGTRGYASPEQYGFSQTDPRSDIYTIGTTLYFLLTGNDPSGHKGFLQLLENNSMVSEKYKKIIKKCCAFDPDNRYSSVKEIKKEIDKKTFINKKSKKKLIIFLCFIVIIGSMTIYNQRFNINYMKNYPIYEVEDVMGPGNISVENVNPIKKGINITEIDEGVMNIQLDFESLGSPFDKAKYISVGTSDSYTTDIESLLQESIYFSVVKGYGYEEYTIDGFNSVVEDRKEMLILIFDENHQCLGYRLIRDINEINKKDSI